MTATAAEPRKRPCEDLPVGQRGHRCAQLAWGNRCRRGEGCELDVLESRLAEQLRGSRELRHELVARGLPRRALEELAAGRDRTEVINAAQEFLDDRKASTLVLLGNVGVGKTFAAVAYLEVHARRYAAVWAARQSASELEQERLPVANVRFITAPAFARLGLFGKDVAEQLEELEVVDHLVLDDLGAEHLSGPFLANLGELLDRRLRECRRTVVTGNISLETFADRYGARLRDRLREAGHVHVLAGESLRGKRRAHA